MKDLTNFELINLNGGEDVSFARKAGRIAGELLAVTAAWTIFVADATVDVIKTVLK
ncbi:hypothetical protein Belba_2216 [Belliella baltica DSM 15883]|uniref:Uncharacterized protein n=2 Tax=Belliella TaxID=232244 RepID=I3Z6B4_BELBD|nr:hypothetical protein Belba_2216 [Belliella baltica DSM 15883]